VCQHTANGNAFHPVIPVSELTSTAGLVAFPASFRFGTATAAFQIESGNHASDWYLWDEQGHVKNNDQVDNGPRSQLHIADDIALMQHMHLGGYRLSLEWSRLFPTRAQFDALTPDADALAYYRELLTKLRAAGIAPMVTLQHFSLPVWLQAPGNDALLGLRDPELPDLLARYAAWAGATFGDLVDDWITINEPLGEIAGGYTDGVFPPGHVLDLDGFEAAFRNLVSAHAKAYDALHGADRADADGDNVLARVSYATHNRAWVPADPNSAADVAGARRVRYVSHLAFLDAVVCGNTDFQFQEAWTATEVPSLIGRLDFIALNYYSVAQVQGIDVEPYLGLPLLSDLPTTRAKDDVGWDISPEGLRAVMEELTPYGLPVVITENGLADATDSRRPKALVQTLGRVQELLAAGFDIRGYYHWSLVDNFEWASGFCPQFGLASFAADGTRTLRPSGDVYARIIGDGGITADEISTYGYGGRARTCE
jgi:beta-glucosidase/6-phospho-beta-glucosidase/beta-galactosidase